MECINHTPEKPTLLKVITDKQSSQACGDDPTGDYRTLIQTCTDK